VCKRGKKFWELLPENTSLFAIRYRAEVSKKLKSEVVKQAIKFILSKNSKCKIFLRKHTFWLGTTTPHIITRESYYALG
jgi:hypothetical protein